MFTGLIEERGQVAAVIPVGKGVRLRIAAEITLEGLKVGDSIAVNGACLTATTVEAGGFTADLMPETLRVTSLGALKPGEPVNLERPLPLGGRLGGHLVTGHVDGVGRIRFVRDLGSAKLFEILAPPEVMRYILPKGSVAVDGVSLTVIHHGRDSFQVSLIPHTLSVTTLGSKGPGSPVNLEADLLGKYVDKLIQPEGGDRRGGRFEIL